VSKIGPFKVWAPGLGEVRIEVEGLLPEETKYGMLIRGLSASAARQLAAELLNAADGADRDEVP
jgi:hypothetical protein